MARKSPGGSLRYTAAEWNAHEDAADDYARRALGEGGGQKHAPLSVGKIRLKNSSGADRRRGEMLKVGAYLLTDVSSEHPWFDGALHDGTDAPFAVLLQPLKDGDIGPAQVLGVCPALVNVTNSAHSYVRPAKDNDVLQSDVLGWAQIIHKPSGTGEKECLVHLGQRLTEASAMLVGALLQGSTATARLFERKGGVWVPIGEVTVCEFDLNVGEEYPTGFKGFVFLDGGGEHVFYSIMCHPDNTGLAPPPPANQGSSGGALLGSASEALFAEVLAGGGDGEAGFYDGELISK